MPNGGMDNCSTCCFNQANDGKIAHHNPDGRQHCLIRGFDIQDPYHTYCANHPLHNHSRIETPIGPVLHGDPRKLLIESPDTPEVRFELLRILDEMPEVPRSDWLTTHLEEDAIEQLGRFREPRAREGLLRVVGFNPFAAPPEDERDSLGRTRRSRIWTVTVAIEALALIAGDEALPFIERYLTPPVEHTADTPHGQWPTEIRFRSVVALDHCSPQRAAELLTVATRDVDPVIAKAAEQRLIHPSSGSS